METTVLPSTNALKRPWDAAGVYLAHSDFVWRSLQRLGVRETDLEDVVQEVFIVVHHRLNTFDASSKMTTWLFGICLRVASNYRRRAYLRYDRPVETVPESESLASDPETALADHQARRLLQTILDQMDMHKRAVFVMFEIDELSSEEIAEILGVPVGTVYSRLFAARKQFNGLLAEHRSRALQGGGK